MVMENNNSSALQMAIGSLEKAVVDCHSRTLELPGGDRVTLTLEALCWTLLEEMAAERDQTLGELCHEAIERHHYSRPSSAIRIFLVDQLARSASLSFDDQRLMVESVLRPRER